VKGPPSLILPAFDGLITVAKDVRMQSAKSEVQTKEEGIKMNTENRRQLFAGRFAEPAARCGAPFVTALLLLSLPLPAQQPDAAAKQQMIQEKVAALKQSLAQNQAALKQYTWTETTEISMKGEVKKREQKECHYGPDGKVQKTPIAGGEPPQQEKEQAGGGRRGRRGGGAVKEKVVEKKVGELKEYMEKVAALVHQYVPPDPAKIQAAAKGGKAAPERSAEGGLTALTFTDYAKAGDKLSLGFDPAAKKIRSYNVASYLDKPEDVVTLAVSFDSLPDGTNYPKETVLDAKAKQIQVKISNSGHKK
jgi:hypothetical protein